MSTLPLRNPVDQQDKQIIGTLDRFNTIQLDIDSEDYMKQDVEKMMKKRTELLMKVAMDTAKTENQIEEVEEDPVEKIKKAYEKSKHQQH